MKIKNTLKRKFFPTHIVEKAIKKYIKKRYLEEIPRL